MNPRPLLFSALCLIFSTLAGAANAQGVAASDTPPKMSHKVEKTEENRQLFVWDRPSEFGKVPADLQAVGDFICAKGRIDLQAIGYHPKAQDKDGLAIPGGGFLCDIKPNGRAPDAQAPRLVRLNQLLGWDRPAAFGSVPYTLLDKGRRVCSADGADKDALGFHPDALDEKGLEIVGGGYLCGPSLKR